MAEGFSTPVRGRSSSSLQAHLFAGSKGGTGKTTTLFHSACQWAKDHPEEKVLVIDISFAGDISERLLGGAQERDGLTAGEHAIHSLQEEGRTAPELFTYLSETVQNYSPPSTQGPSVQPRTTPKFDIMRSWRRLNLGGPKEPPAPEPPAPAARNIVDDFGVAVSDRNPRIPMKNLYLIASGGTGRQPCAGLDMGEGQDAFARRIAKSLRQHLHALSGTWRVFFDSDGDLDFSTSLKVALRCCDSVALFTETDPADFRRIRIFIQDLANEKMDMLEAAPGEEDHLVAGVAAIVFNKVAAAPRAERFEAFNCNVKPFIVAVRELTESFANIMADFVTSQDDVDSRRLRMFTKVPEAALTADLEARRRAFITNTFMVMQDFMKAGLLASDLGIPLCCIDYKQSYVGQYATYKVDNEERLKALVDNVRELNARL